MSARIRVGITVGDPAGIGPELARAAAVDPRVTAVCEPVLYGPAADNGVVFSPGVLSAEAGRAAYEAVERATADAVAGRIDAVATGPIHKEAFALAGFTWRGHTELLAHLTEKQTDGPSGQGQDRWPAHCMAESAGKYPLRDRIWRCHIDGSIHRVMCQDVIDHTHDITQSDPTQVLTP